MSTEIHSERNQDYIFDIGERLLSDKLEHGKRYPTEPFVRSVKVVVPNRKGGYKVSLVSADVVIAILEKSNEMKERPQGSMIYLDDNLPF